MARKTTIIGKKSPWEKIVVEQDLGAYSEPLKELWTILNSKFMRESFFITKKVDVNEIEVSKIKLSFYKNAKSLDEDSTPTKELVLNVYIRCDTAIVESIQHDYTKSYKLVDMQVKDDILSLLHGALPNVYPEGMELL